MGMNMVMAGGIKMSPEADLHKEVLRIMKILSRPRRNFSKVDKIRIVKGVLHILEKEGEGERYYG
ncbi:MAG: hypothetical protein U9Q72_03690 [Patescibacteria group bacterium]|nr:hypothetical protein [Patescibacteria group bacterium]